MELDISQKLQVAGLLGLGLLYQRSAHRHMTEVCIGRTSESFSYLLI